MLTNVILIIETTCIYFYLQYLESILTLIVTGKLKSRVKIQMFTLIQLLQKNCFRFTMCLVFVLAINAGVASGE